MTENKPNFLKLLGAIFVVALAFGFAAPSATHAAEPVEQNAATVTVAATDLDEEINDPLESMNRLIFDFNEGLQDGFLRPVANFYNNTVNATVREAISNFLNNLSTPVILANDLLQGEFERALKTLTRALVNSTFGMGGIADIAGELGLERHDEDFGQTLAVYGVGEGFYLVLPVFGPSSPRDAIGKLAIDSYLDPLGLWLDNTDRDEIIYGLTAAKGLDQYADIVDELNQVKKTSVDYYAAIRSLYRQKRKAEILNGSTLDLPPIPDLSYNAVPEDFDQPLAVMNQPPQN